MEGDSPLVEPDVDARMRALLDAIPDLMFRITADGMYVDFAGDAALLANPWEDVVGGRVDELLPPEVAEPLMLTTRRALETGTLQTVAYVLRTIEGSALPYTVPNTVGNTVVVNSATATLGDSGTYAVAGTGTISGVVNTVLTDNGDWVQNGEKVNFTSAHISGAFYFAKAKEDTLTLTLTRPGAPR